MCGVFGIRRFDGAPVERGALQAMADVLGHRGPDALDFDVEGAVGFGHTRLSIIDLAGSPQPMRSPSGRSLLTFNGEIFNYRQVRSALPFPYRTDGDTEVVLASLVERGRAGVDGFVGQFAAAFHDFDQRRTWLFRDRVGVLPLYYWLDAEQLVFASEPKAILAVLGDRVGLDHEQVRAYLKGRAVPAPATLFAGIRKVPPGHFLEVLDGGAASVEPYWLLPAPDDLLEVTSEEAVDLVDDALRAAVDAALVADVPVGSYLSGGVDSSLVVALATRARREAGATTPLSTFSAEFGDARFDETTHASAVSELFGTDHHRVLVKPHDFAEQWERLTWHRDAPVSEPADIAVAQLATTAREHVSVVLSGEGADELFGGYPKYRYAAASELAGRVPSRVRVPVARLVERSLPRGRGKLRIAVRAMSGVDGVRMGDWFAPFTDHEVDRLLGPGPGAGRRGVVPDHRDAIDLMARTDLAAWLPDNLLERGDRMSMAASLELRPPFLDHRLVELAFRLPSEVKVRGGETKWVVKEVAERYLPESIVRRPKVGFRVPLDAWFRGALEDMARDLLTSSDSFVASVTDAGTVAQLLESHRSGRRDEEIRIWTLLSLEMWGRRFLRTNSLRTDALI